MKHGRVFSHCRGTYEYRLTVVKRDSTDFFMYRVQTFNQLGKEVHPAFDIPGLCYLDDDPLKHMMEGGFDAYPNEYKQQIIYVAQSLRFVDRNECTVEVA